MAAAKSNVTSWAEQEKVLLQIFKDIDVDNSGSVSRDELYKYMRTKNLPDNEIEGLFRQLDLDSDGIISFDEYQEKVGLIPPKSRKGMVWKTVFDSYDEDHDGYLSVDELWKCVAEMGIDKSIRKEDIAEAISGFDTNKDGRIDLKEYVKWLTDQDI